MKQKTILIVAPYGFNDRMMSFVEFSTARLLERNDWRVFAFVKSERDSEEKKNVCGIHVYRYESLFHGCMKMIYWIVAHRPSIVHIHNLRNNRVGIITAMLARLLHIPLAFTEYGLLHDHYLVSDRDDPFSVTPTYENVIASIFQLLKSSRHNPRKFFYFVGSYMFHWPLMHADSVVFVSKHNLAIAEKLGIKNYRILPYINDDSRWETTKDINHDSLSEHEKQITAMLNSVPDSSCALFIGQMKLRKGWDILIKAIPLIERTIFDRFIFITSSTSQEIESYSLLVDTLNIRDRILFLGKIPNNTLMRKSFEKSALVIVPSLYEGFGLVPLEAFELGKPVVASRVEALTDFLIDGKNAALVSPKDPKELAKTIMHVMHDKTLYTNLADGGKKTLSLLRSAEYSNRWLHFYETLLGNNSTEIN